MEHRTFQMGFQERLPHSCRELVIASLVYFVLSIAFGWELLVPGRSLFRWDTVLYNWPVLLETRAQWLAGHTPFWASSFCCGTPLLPNINAGVLYPLRLPCWLLPLPAGYHVFLFIHLWLSFVGMHFLLRSGMRVSRAAAFVGALAFGASGYARGMWDTHNFMALPWVPIGLGCLLLARQARRQPLAIIGVTLSWAMLVLCGDFQSAVLWVPVALLLALLMPCRKALLGVIAVSVVLGSVLTAPQWVPALFAMGESYRAGGLPYAEAVERSLNPTRLLELFTPYLFGTREQWFGHSLPGPQALKTLPWTSSVHVGGVALGLAVLALRRRENPVIKWACLITAVAFALSFGHFLPLFETWLSLPVIGGFRYPEKYVLWATLGLACLAACGTDALLTMLTHQRFSIAVRRFVFSWCTVLVVAAAIGSVSLIALTSHADGMGSWLLSRWLSLGILLACIFVFLRVAHRKRRAVMALVFLVLIDQMMSWRLEQPTTRNIDPLERPVVARVLEQSVNPGRVMQDPSVGAVPLKVDVDALNHEEGMVALRQSTFSFNTPRLWGLSSAAGFSPLESDRMRDFRFSATRTEDGSIADAATLGAFCEEASVEWLLTTAERGAELASRFPGSRAADQWGPNGETVLLKLGDTKEARCDPLDPNSGVRVRGVWRMRPGMIRVDLEGRGASALKVSETYAAGWRARDQLGHTLPVSFSDHGFIQVQVPDGVSQVRLNYVPKGWRLGLVLGGLGGLVLLVICVIALGKRHVISLCGKPAFIACVACLLFLVFGVAARNHWACTFDEGFHVARGMARLRTGDARMSYYHPPLQNLVCAYFGNLACGERIRVPAGPAWESADISFFGSQLAGANPGAYRDLVRATRWGSCGFALLLLVAGVLWGGKIAGSRGAWLCGIGLALNPNLLAHGNLTTTDMGPLAMTMVGTAMLWAFTKSGRHSQLAWTTCCFALCAVLKHWGLMWLACYLLICLPLLAVLMRSGRVMWQIPIGLGLLALFLLCLYGPTPQVIRGADGQGWGGGPIIAGKYIEGLVIQGKHSLLGHRAYFNGERFMQGHWWYTLVSIALKSPPLWLLGVCLGLVGLVRRRRPFLSYVPFVPLAIYAVLLLFVNRMSIGVRHALPLVAFGAVLGAVWFAKLSSPVLKRYAALAWVLGALVSALSSFPHYISYFPGWAGGVSGGHRWMVDSSYDWGQDLEKLEAQWASVTDANGGTPPHLMYFGFLDPEHMYGMRVAGPSLKGFMGRAWALSHGQDVYKKWVSSFSTVKTPTVCSVSALHLDPYGIDMRAMRSGQDLGRIGHTFRLILPEN